MRLWLRKVKSMAGKYELEHIPGGREHQIAPSGTRLGLIARGRKEASNLTSPTFEALQVADLMSFDFIVLDFDRGDIESGNTSDVMGVLAQLLERDAATKFCERVEVCCTGYNSDSRELWEIPQVREFVKNLDRQFPYWCYFLSRNGEGLLWLTYCLYPLALTQDEKQRLWIPAIAKYIEGRGIPQMNAMCRYVGCSNEEVLRLTNGAVSYLVNKPQGKYANDQDTQHGSVQTPQRFRKVPERNDANAQFYLGSLYCRSDVESKNKGDFVVTQDDGLAGMWFRKAADNGHAGAQNALGVLYHFGHGVKRDDKQAAHWYRRAAEHGDADAQYNLGNSYCYGNGIARDYTQAAFWFRKAADQGNAGAQFALGVLYDEGKGVPQDLAKAASWFQKAAEQGLADAQYNVGIKHTKGEGLPQDYDQAATWLKKAVSQGHAEAKAVLGMFYSKGLVPKR
jgi:TPR repeat protein